MFLRSIWHKSNGFMFLHRTPKKRSWKWKLLNFFSAPISKFYSNVVSKNRKTRLEKEVKILKVSTLKFFNTTLHLRIKIIHR